MEIKILRRTRRTGRFPHSAGRDDAVEEGPEQGEQYERRREAVAHRFRYFAALADTFLICCAARRPPALLPPCSSARSQVQSALVLPHLSSNERCHRGSPLLDSSPKRCLPTAALCRVVEPFARSCKAVPSAFAKQMPTIVRAGLRGTALGAVSYPSVDAETTPEGYCG